MPEILNQHEFGPNNAESANTDRVAPVSPTPNQPQTQYGDTTMDEPVVNESDDLDFIRSLAGLSK